MARELLVRLADDVDGSDAVETVVFAFRGVDYEIDLNEEHLKDIERDLQVWIDRARKTTRGGDRSPRARRDRARSATTEDTSSVRAWARGTATRFPAVEGSPPKYARRFAPSRVDRLLRLGCRSDAGWHCGRHSSPPTARPTEWRCNR